MALQRTKLLDIKSVTGVSTVGIFTVGVNQTPVGIASTSYVRSVVMHNTGVATARVGLYIIPGTNPVTSTPLSTCKILSLDMAANETAFFETNYPVVLNNLDSIGVDITPPDSGGTGIGSAVNFIINGDTDIV